MLICGDARLIAIRTPSGVFLEQANGASRFTRDDWIGYRAVGVPQPMQPTGAAANGIITCDDTSCALRPRGDALGAFLLRNSSITPITCRQTAVLVAAAPARGLCPRPWPALVDRFTVWRFGATAIWLDAPHIRIITDRAFRGRRPWVIPLPAARTASPRVTLLVAPAE